MNSFKNILINGANKEFLCSNCKSCLSVEPIVCNSIYGNICGRKMCANLAATEGSNSTQVLYESVARYLMFPCAYRNGGCVTELKWGEVKAHEDICYFRKIECPFYNKMSECNEKCEWNGESTEMLSHVNRTHPENEFRNPRLIDDLDEPKLHIFFTSVRGAIVLISLLIDHKKNLFCKIWTTESIRNGLKYQIKFLDETALKSIPTGTLEVEILRRRSLEQNIIENCTTIDLKTMKTLLGSMRYMTIEFILDNCPEEIQGISASPFRQLSGFYNRALKKKCDFCNVELSPPTFTCVNGHIICTWCIVDDLCPICSTVATQNKSFDKLKVLLDEPCSNSGRGCKFIASYLCTRYHERNCEYSGKYCIKCDMPIPVIFTHVEQVHSEDMIGLGKLYKLQWNLSTTSDYFISFDNQIFYFCIQPDDMGGLSYNLISLGMKRVKYRYQFHLMDNKLSGAKIMLSNFCHPEEVVMGDYDINKNFTYATEIHPNVFKQMFPFPNDIEFKLSITKLLPSKLEDEENDVDV
ncbi:hypothetical protein WA026_022615 [Henosepilachna vigintioctopunctata]|uniref:RING-type E3 ubiquitin transferase n=1 Tax=Henosepilachna vigintioctopunctata TaxID=420089 RepID=A0AAW1UXB6_9CUCU